MVGILSHQQNLRFGLLVLCYDNALAPHESENDEALPDRSNLQIPVVHAAKNKE
jgi:hypothetical protein